MKTQVMASAVAGGPTLSRPGGLQTSAGPGWQRKGKKSFGHLTIDTIIEQVYFNLNNEMEVHGQMDKNELLGAINRMIHEYGVEQLKCIYFFSLHLGKGVACDE